MKPKTSPLIEQRAKASNPSLYGSGPQSQIRRRRRTRVVLNVRLLVISVIVLVVATPSAVLWHSFQLRRNRDVFLARADAAEQRAQRSDNEAEQKQQWREAARYLYRYLQLDPGEEETQRARARLAIATDEGAETNRARAHAANLYVNAIRLSDDPDDLKHRLGILLLQWPVRGVPDTYDYLASLFSDTPEHDAAGQAIRSLARYRQARYDAVDSSSSEAKDAVDELKRVVENPPDDVVLSSLYAAACLELQQESIGSGWIQDRADPVIKHMVEANQEDALAYLARYQYRIARAQIGRLAFRRAEADEDLKRALDLAPNNVEVLLAAGARATSDEDFEKGLEYFEAIRQIDPSDARVYLHLGQMHAAQDDAAEALRVWEQGIEVIDLKDPESLAVHMSLVDRLVSGLLAADGAGKALEVLTDLRTRVERAYYLTSPKKAQILVSIDYSRGLSHAALGQYRAAVPLLDRAVLAWERPGNDIESVQRLRAIETLAACYQQLATPDEAIRMLQKAQLQLASMANPQQAPAVGQMRTRLHAASADALFATGRYDGAVREYGLALDLLDQLKPARVGAEQEEQEDDAARRSLRVKLATAHYQRQANLPSAERDWGQFDAVLDKAKDPKYGEPGSPQLALLEIQALAAKGEEQKALESLEKAEGKFPDSHVMWQAVILGQDAWGDADEADRKLQQYVARAPNANVALMLKASLLSRRREWEKVRDLFLHELKPENEQGRIARELRLVQLDQLLGDIEAAEERLSNLVKGDYDRLNYVQKQAIVRTLAEMALAMPERDSQKVEDRIEQVRKLEQPELEAGEDGIDGQGGGSGTWWRYLEAMRLLSDSEQITGATLQRAERLQSSIEQVRPNWPQSYVLKAEIAAKRNNLKEATDLLKYAIQMGYRSLPVYQRLTELLVQQGRSEEVDTFLSELGDRVLNSPGLSNLAIRRSIDQLFGGPGPNAGGSLLGEADEEVRRAVRLARANVERSPENLAARIWLGYTLLLDGENAAAEAAFRKAVELEPQNVGARVALFTYFAGAGQRDKALEVLRELERIELSTQQESARHFALAQGYERLGDEEQAAANYGRAVERAPENIAVLNGAANFFLRTDSDAAENVLRQLIEVSKGKRSAQRRLALRLASRGGRPRWEEALGIADALLEEANDGPEGAVNRRLKAFILTTRRGDQNRDEAVRLLEEVVQGPAAAPSDLLRLANLYGQQGNGGLALEQIEQLQGRPDLTPEDLAGVVRFCLEAERFELAGSALDSLQDQAPDSVTTIALRARYLHSTKQSEQISSVVEAFADRRIGDLQEDGLRAELLSNIAAVYASVDMPESAESYFREAAELAPSRSQAFAAWLATQGRNGEALQIAIAALDRQEIEKSPEAIANTLNLLTVGDPTPEDFRSAQGLIAEAEELHQDNVAVLAALAMVHYRQQDLEKAVDSFRKVLKIDANHLMALNNLAWTLAEKDRKTDPALRYIDDAIDYYGPNLQLLDTRGMILLLGGQAANAVAQLREVANQDGADPQHQFHLALALQKLGNADLARQQLETAKTARDGGLSRQNLTPFEQDLLEHLQEALGN